MNGLRAFLVEDTIDSPSRLGRVVSDGGSRLKIASHGEDFDILLVHVHADYGRLASDLELRARLRSAAFRSEGPARLLRKSELFRRACGTVPLGEDNLRVTASIGVAELSPSEPHHARVKRDDQAVYLANH